jgi:hypothetical protein
MIKFNRLLLIFCALGGFSCSSSKMQVENIVLGKTVMTEAYMLVPERIHIEEYIYAKRFFVYADSVLIILNKPSSVKPFIELVKLSDGSAIAKLFNYGNGPAEMLLATVNLSDNVLIAKDIQKKQIAFVNIDSVLNSLSYKVGIQNYQIRASSINKNRDGMLIFENPYCFKNEKYKIDNKAERFIVGNENTTDGNLLYYKFDTSNVTDGNIIVNRNRDRIVYAALSEPLIEIYDRDLTLKRIITGPNFHKEQTFTVRSGDEGLPSVVFRETIPYAYITYCHNDKNIYFSFVGELMQGRNNTWELDSYIFKFDWNGNFIKSYSTNKFINAMSVGQDDDTIYASSYDEDGLPILLKYHCE